MNRDYLKLARINKGYSQTEVAKNLGVSESMVCQWEKSNKNPKVDTLTKLCKLLEMDANKLLNLE